MSEIKPRQMWFDTEVNSDNTICALDLHFEKPEFETEFHLIDAAPALQMMKEMVKQYGRLLKSIPYNYIKPDYFIVHEANLENYKSFLSQIESEGK